MTFRQTIALGDVCSFQKGASIPRDNTGADLDIPYLHYGDVYKKYSVYVDIDEVFGSIIKISADEKIKPEQQLHDQDIVYNLTSETIDDLGKSVIIRSREDRPFIAGMETTVMRVEARDVVYPPYLNYVLQTKGFYRLLQQYVTGMKVFRVHPRDISRISLNLPSLEEQRWIADLGDALTDSIDKNDRINNHLEQMAQAIFKSWFVDFEPFGGEQPSSWAVSKAEDFFDIAIGKTPPRKEPEWFTTNPQDVIWVSISDMGNCGMFISDSSEYLTAESVSRFNVKVVPSRTVLLSFKLTVGRVAITDGEMTTNEAIAHFKQASDVPLEYLYCYLRAFDYQSLGNTSSIATAVNSKTIKAMPFIMPDDKVLVEFHAATAPLFEQVRAKLAENKRLAEIRDSLLPRLMSGELSVADVTAK